MSLASVVWTVIGGWDRTLSIPNDGIKFSGAVGDQQPKATIDVRDNGNLLTFNIGDEVIIWDGNAPAEGTLHGPVASPPAHNMLLAGAFSTGWTAINALAGNFTLTDSGATTTLTFSNSTGQGLQVQETPRGYVHVGQSYMLSVYATIAAPLVNANAQVMLQFLDGAGNALATNVLTFSSTTGNAQQQVSISAVAPAGSVYAQALLGGQTTVNGSNSHSVKYGSPQLEPMWFATTQGLSYPTPDCNNAQADCAQMPDNTTSRMCRLFSGAIDDWKIVEYDGPNRIYELSVAGSGYVLEDGNINSSYEAQYDDQILSDIVSTYFSGILSVAAPNTSSALPVIRAALIDAISYNDNSLREVCNGLTSESNSIFYVDPYYTLRYNPSYYSAVSFALTDQTPDNVTTFNYYEYYPEQDGTQMAQDVKVTGGKFIAPAITDTFSANGSTSVFNLSQQPYNITSVISNSNSQKCFIKGTGPTLGVNGYVGVIDKTAKTLTFNFNPTSGTNNVTCTYSYEAPVSVEVMAQQALTPPNAPAYVNRKFSAKVNDTNLLTIPAAIQRGLSEITQFGQPLSILDLKCSQYIPAGYIVFFTSTPDNIINQPYVCQQVDFVYLGNGLAEWHYTLGAWRPHLLDHIRNANKAVNRSKTTTNINLPQQTDLVFNEKVLYSESITITLVTPNTSTYGTGVYGTTTFA